VFQQFGEHLNGAALPLVEEGEQQSCRVVEQGPAADVPGGSPGPAAALLAVTLLGAGCLKRSQRSAQARECGAGHPGQPFVAEPGQHLLTAAGRAGGLTGGALADGGGGGRWAGGGGPGGLRGGALQARGVVWRSSGRAAKRSLLMATPVG